MKPVISGTGSLALILASLGSVALPTGAANAASWSQTQCEADGGTYYKSGSDSRCVYPVEQSKPGHMPDGYNGGALTETQTTTDGQGNLTNKQTSSTTCDGNRGQCSKQ